VTPGQPIQISEGTKEKYKVFKNGVEKTFDFAGGLIMKVLTPV